MIWTGFAILNSKLDFVMRFFCVATEETAPSKFINFTEHDKVVDVSTEQHER